MKRILLMLLITSLSFAQTYEKGILVEPIKIDKSIKVEAGSSVEYKPSSSSKFKIDIKVNDTTYNQISDYYVIPYDSEFSPSRIFLYLIDERYYNYAEQIRTKRDLAKNCLKIFPNHFLAEELNAQYCIYSKICMEYPDGVKGIYDTEIKIFNDFILKYPASIYIDRFKWQIVQMENYSYEYEGFASAPLSEVRAYEKFLQKNSNSKLKDEIKSTCAYLYRVAYEIMIDNPENHKIEGFTLSVPEELIQKSIKYYTELLACSDIQLRESSRVALYNIKHNRTTYVGNTDW
jgi:hypothetical protein